MNRRGGFAQSSVTLVPRCLISCALPQPILSAMLSESKSHILGPLHIGHPNKQLMPWTSRGAPDVRPMPQLVLPGIRADIPSRRSSLLWPINTPLPLPMHRHSAFSVNAHCNPTTRLCHTAAIPSHDEPDSRGKVLRIPARRVDILAEQATANRQQHLQRVRDMMRGLGLGLLGCWWPY